MVERIVDFFEPFFSEWGYLIVGIAGLLENSIGAGLVFPGETLVILGGFYAASGDLSLPVVATVAAVAGTLGDNIGYFIGRKVGRRFFEKYGRFVLLSPKRLEKAESFYRRHGGKTVFLGRFIPVVRSVGCLLAGTSRFPYRRFFLFDLAGAVLWAIANTIVGFLLGKGYDKADKYLGAGGVAAIVLLVLLVWLSAKLNRRRRLKEEASPSE